MHLSVLDARIFFNLRSERLTASRRAYSFTTPQYPFHLFYKKLLFESSHSLCHHPNTLSPIIERIRAVTSPY